MYQNKLLIAIDGPSSSGKGTIAKKIAKHFNLPCLNTGAIYRNIAFLALSQNLDLKKNQEKIINICQNITNITNINLESEYLNTEEIGKAASIIATNPNIRKAIFDLQRNFAINGMNQKGGAILEGRDIGTVICPDANYKFFINASLEVRAQRRLEQIQKNQKSVTDYQKVLQQLQDRDNQDRDRITSPLKKAPDAIEIDTSFLNVDQVLKKILKIVEP